MKNLFFDIYHIAQVMYYTNLTRNIFLINNENEKFLFIEQYNKNNFLKYNLKSYNTKKDNFNKNYLT